MLTRKMLSTILIIVLTIVTVLSWVAWNDGISDGRTRRSQPCTKHKTDTPWAAASSGHRGATIGSFAWSTCTIGLREPRLMLRGSRVHRLRSLGVILRSIRLALASLTSFSGKQSKIKNPQGKALGFFV